MRATAVLFAFVALVLTVFAQGLRVKIENRVPLFDVGPTYRNRVAMVPVRSMIEAMDGTMKWDMATQTVRGWVSGRTFEVVLRSRNARINDRNATLEEGTFIHDGRIFVPLRFLAEATGHIVSEEGGWYVLRPVSR